MKHFVLAAFAVALLACEANAQGCNGYQAGQRRTLLPHARASNGCNGGAPQTYASNGCNGFQAGTRTYTVVQSNSCFGGAGGVARQSFTPVQTATGVQMVPVNPAPAATATAPAASQPITTAPGVVAGGTIQTVEPPLFGQTAIVEEAVMVEVPRRRALLPWNRR